MRMLSVLAVGYLAAMTLLAASPPITDALTEFSADTWGTDAQSATADVYDDTSRFMVGSSSLRFETDGCLDTYLWAPFTDNGDWDLASSGSGGVGFWVYAENNNLGFQDPQPGVRLGTGYADYYEYIPSTPFLNQARDQWLYVTIPLNGDDTWARNTVGNPDLAHINYIEIHADTWDCGFTLWFDGLTFDVQLSPPEKQVAVAGNGRVELEWLPFVDVGGLFDHYAIYRSTSPFVDVTSMTPIDTISSVNTTTYVDTTASNGVGYHYAVTAVFTNGQETTEVESVGPRVPRDEDDLQVACISRTPRYPRYAATYTGYWITEPSGYGPYFMTAATGLSSGQDGSTQRWPDVGDPITYTATVRNRGTNTRSGTLGGSWSVDGSPVTNPSKSVALAPGDTTTFEYTRMWDDQWHEVAFELNVVDERDENDARSVHTKSAAFLTYVDIGAIEDFRDRTSPDYPGRATDDLIDWLQRHADEMNQMFADTGSLKRVHYDVLLPLHDHDPDPTTPETINFGVFPFRYYGSTIGDPRSPGYYRTTPDIDYGLCHEMSHQLGLIDIYQLNLAGGDNAVSGQGYTATPGLMNGVSDFYSAHSAGGMTQWADTAHGYFGQYMYDIPSEIRLRVLDVDGQPLANATVTMYQKNIRPDSHAILTDQVKAQGVTDTNGVWTLPNVPIDPNIVPTTYAGDTLPDNPFGYLACVGYNGLLHFKVEFGDFVDYAWLDITEVNNAYWTGDTAVATFDRQLSLGGTTQQYPPEDMAELNADEWSGWAQDGAITLSDETSDVVVGDGAIEIVATGGADNYVRYPHGLLAEWDLSDVDSIRFWALAENDFSFQGHSPWVRLGNHQDGYFEWRPNYEALNQAIGTWTQYVIPIEGDATWARTTSGTPDLSDINYLQIHADTWDYGFVLWLDGVGFDPTPAPDGCVGDCDCDGSRNYFDINYFIAALGGEAQWSQYYRDQNSGADPPCDYAINCDVDGQGDGATYFDINPFLDVLGQPCE